MTLIYHLRSITFNYAIIHLPSLLVISFVDRISLISMTLHYQFSYKLYFFQDNNVSLKIPFL